MKIQIMLTGERESIDTEVLKCIDAYLCVHFLKNQSRKTYFWKDTFVYFVFFFIN